VLVFCHLLVGTAIGLVIYHRTRLRAVVPLAAVGAILPDLIDKPLRHLLLQSTLDSGRIYAHTLLFLGMVGLAGMLYWKVWLTPLMLAVAAGVASHLVLDSMWTNPTTLFWPALGPFEPMHYPDYFEGSFLVELTSPLEWLFGFSLVAVLAALFADHQKPRSPWLAGTMVAVRRPLFALLMVAGIMNVALALLVYIDDLERLESMLIAGSCAFLSGYYLLSIEIQVIPPSASEAGSRPGSG
jgi:membrane-bound metal-dependent hydrolase YbcI (DUF457 family)